ncbi:O-acyltransferase like protein [Papilio machaon]|uniref:O-acyltransferase like protein n=1 Tax=Papilio machaon TaxID=76193 RepID=UPI001E663B4A|nr:O-acyltransferase like protein [Papilio machaon]
MIMAYLQVICLSAFFFVSGNAQVSMANKNSAFDLNLYEKVLDPKLCRKQIRYMAANSSVLLAQFLDAGLRVPKGFFDGNADDLGNYYQCLAIDAPFGDSRISGKYCVVQVPLSQDLTLPGFSGKADALNVNKLKLGPAAQLVLEKYYTGIKGYRALSGTHLDDRVAHVTGTLFKLAVCIPRPCTTEVAVTTLLFNLSTIGFDYQELFCRLPNDKPWVSADSAAVLIFFMIGLLTLMSSVYELTHIFLLKKDPKSVNIYYRSFSIYSNTHSLFNIPKEPHTLMCLNGIRTIATVWIIVGHSFSSLSGLLNPFRAWEWMISFDGLWVSSTPITVDTFITITGILLVFTTAKKMDAGSLLRNLHIFYLNRLLRMFPLLATAILFDASVFHRIGDGPYWMAVATNAQKCREYWWTTLLHLQNYLNPKDICVPHSWYIAVDVQLHILSPLVLYWILRGRKQTAWFALLLSLTVTLIVSAIYNGFMDLPAHTISPARNDRIMEYMTKYYFHLISRIAPFLVGMMYGYILHLWRGKRVLINAFTVQGMWVVSLCIISGTLYMLYRVKQLDWNYRAADAALNTLMRPLWAAAVGWMVLACAHGYGGPINWFLSLPLWRLPGRLTYGMYLFHYPIIVVVNGTIVGLQYFSVANVMYQALSFLVLSFILSFILTVVIEEPFTIIFKSLLDKGLSKSNNEEKKLGEIEAFEIESRKDED